MRCEAALAVMKSGMTMMVVAHGLGFEREDADWVVYIYAGSIVDADSPAPGAWRAEDARTRAFLTAVIG